VRSKRIYRTMGEGEGCYVLRHFLQKSSENDCGSQERIARYCVSDDVSSWERWAREASECLINLSTGNVT